MEPPWPERGDYSASFASIRNSVADSHGVRLVDWVGTLTPHYGRLYRDLAVGCAALVGSVLLTAVGQTANVTPFVLVPLGAVLVGYWYFYLVSFIHEGVHWNLARDRTVNDRITNALTSCMLGTHLTAWRPHHFEHHRALGTVADTERSYFDPLNGSALVKSLFGARAIEAIASYLRRTSDRARRVRRRGASSRIDGRVVSLVTAATVHGLVVVGLWTAGWTAAAMAWVAGVGGVMPVFNTVRQVLEHRADDARGAIDYSRIDQGACTRIFGRGWFDRVFGSAGANLHLLHHWEPQVSYTRLADLERFLADTPARAMIDGRRTTYTRAFRELFAAR